MMSFYLKELSPIVSPTYLKEYDQKVELKSKYLYFRNPKNPVMVRICDNLIFKQELLQKIEELFINNPPSSLLCSYLSKREQKAALFEAISFLLDKTSVLKTIKSFHNSNNKEYQQLIHNKELKQMVYKHLINKHYFAYDNKQIARLLLSLDCLKYLEIQAKFELCGKVVSNDNVLVKKLLQQGGIMSRNQIETPQYNSWADIDPGYKITLEKQGIILEYIPKNECIVEKNYQQYFPIYSKKEDSVGKYIKTQTVPQVVLQCNHTNMLQTIIQKYDQIQETSLDEGKDQLFTLTVKDITKKKVTKKVQLRTKDIFCELFVPQKDSEIYMFKEMINHLEKNISKSSYFHFYPFPLNAETSNLKNNSITIAKAKKIKDPRWLKEQEKTTLQRETLPEELIQKITDICKVENIQIIHKYEYVHRTIFEFFLQAVSKQFDLHSLSEEQIHNTKMLLQEIALYWLIHSRSIDTKKITQYHLRNFTPFSERGELKISFLNFMNYDEALKLCASLGIISSFERPLKDRGYIHPICSESKSLKLPYKKVILHGMTGCKDSNKAFLRLQKIVSQGGILSQAERRKYNIGVHSMSPLGDLASGLDWAVPATITNAPKYGNFIFFVLSPTLLERKHLFFSPTDFGGGRDRSYHYNRYAKEIGQNSFTAPITKQSKIQHLKTNTIQRPLNEIWFDHSVGVENITHILVIEDIVDDVKQLLNKNPETQHIQIRSFQAQRVSTDINQTFYPSTLSKTIEQVSRQQQTNYTLLRNIKYNISQKYIERRENKVQKVSNKKMIWDDDYNLQHSMKEEDFKDYFESLKKAISSNYD